MVYDNHTCKEFEYLDNNDARTSWKTFCTRLKAGICEKSISFKGASPNISIRVIDKAGNSVQEEVA